MKSFSRWIVLGLTLGLSLPSAHAQMMRKRSYQDETLPSELGTSFDNTVDRKAIKARRVAIIPNRMPLFLTEADMWRKYNWQVLAGMFEDRGYDVVDFDSSAEAFTRANLPMEDTGASEEKFSRLANILQADILVMPFYGTSFQSKTLLVATSLSFIGLVTLQVYSAQDNKFIYRSDQTGKTGYFQGWAFVGMIVGTIAGGPTKTTDEVTDYGFGPVTTQSIGMNPVYFAAVIGGAAIDIGQALMPTKRRYEMAFLKADRAALQPFFASFPGPMGSGKKKKVIRRVVRPAEEESSSPPPAKTAPAAAPARPAPAASASAPASPAKPAPAKPEEDKKEGDEDLGLGVDQ